MTKLGGSAITDALDGVWSEASSTLESKRSLLEERIVKELEESSGNVGVVLSRLPAIFDDADIRGVSPDERERFADLVSNALIGKTVAGRCTRVLPESVTIEEGHNSYCLLDADAAKAATHGG